MSTTRTPLTDALQAEHRGDISCGIVYDHARRMERDRARLMECLRLFDYNYQDGYIKGHATIIKQTRALLRELEGK